MTNDPFAAPRPDTAMADDAAAYANDVPEPATKGMSSIYKLFEAFIALREKNERQHTLFDREVKKSRDTLVEKFNGFAGETQRAYQNLRGELTGEKRLALAILKELVDVALDMERIVRAKPELPTEGEQADAIRNWAAGVEIQHRNIIAALQRHGVQPYDVVVGEPYDPARHERIGTTRMEGMDPNRVARQQERGWASQHEQHGDFVLIRPKILVSE